VKAILALGDGRVFEGVSFGAQGEVTGEVCFNTSMVGYQEILTDPSYAGQIITMTYPLIGNYGVNADDSESDRPHCEGFVVREISQIASNWRSEGMLSDLLAEGGVVGISGIDTRALTKHIRSAGAMTGVLSSTDLDPASLAAKAKAAPGLVGRDLVAGVSVAQQYAWPAPDEAEFEVVAYDFGMKRNIARRLAAAGCSVTVVPAKTPAEAVMAMGPDGVFLSNGPGDPEPIVYAVDAVRDLLGKVPVFGICLGHQLLGLALGAKTYKLKFGHRGANQPVMNMATRAVEITSQNHGFAVDFDSIGDVADDGGVRVARTSRFGEVELSHLNLNDETVEGLRCRDVGAFSVQYHPEASPGPHDSRYLFGQFADMMRQAKSAGEAGV
jgi:carbamoyl-phosphate synthase small subunit